MTAKGDTLPLRNIFARFRPQATTRILYMTHWDSRPVSDQAEDPARRSLPVPGANDGASGVGLFIALGDVLKKTPPTVGVDLLFVDGEDYGTLGPPDVDVLLGSTYFAANMPAGYQPIFGVLFDMIGDADLEIPQEAQLLERAPEVVSRVWDTAAKLGYQRLLPAARRWAITDDHIPLLDKGLRSSTSSTLITSARRVRKPNYHHTPETRSTRCRRGRSRSSVMSPWRSSRARRTDVRRRVVQRAMHRRRQGFRRVRLDQHLPNVQ